MSIICIHNKVWSTNRLHHNIISISHSWIFYRNHSSTALEPRHHNALHKAHSADCAEMRADQSVLAMRCTHLNGHHSIKQSCPKSSEHFISFSQGYPYTWMYYVLFCVCAGIYSFIPTFQLFADRQKLSNSSQMKVTKMLLIVSTVFVLLNLPDYVLRIQGLIVRDLIFLNSIIIILIFSFL